MKKYDVIIIGAGPAGIVTGVTAKNQFPDKSMLLIGEEEKGLVPCGIPYIFYDLNSVDKNATGPKPFVDAGGVAIADAVVNVNIDNKKIKVKSGNEFSFDKLVFATGSDPVVASFIPGHDLKNVFYIKKSYNYITKLFNKLKNKKNIVVVGGGFIGAEVAEQLAKHSDKKVTIIESEEFCFSKAFSNELSKMGTEQLRKTNLNVYTSTFVDKVLGKDGVVTGVQFQDETIVEADAVIFAIGYKPNSELAEKAGLENNAMGAIIVDNYGRTSRDDIFAVGDCSQTIGYLTGRMDNIMLASTATAEARLLGYSMFGVEIRNHFIGTIGIVSTVINGFTMASAGLNENDAATKNIDLISAEFSDFNRHPETIEDASPLTVKLYVSPFDGSILGGEVWGGKSAGELINTIGLAIQKELAVYDLISLQIGTHPLLTTAPTKHLCIRAAEIAIAKIKGLIE